mgnify:CR=1 FL=1
MTVKNAITGVTAWVGENICRGIFLKSPDDDATFLNGGLVEPVAFPVFLPSSDRLPPKVSAPVPSVCVQIKKVRDAPGERRRVLDMRLAVAVWNPGRHGSEMRYPQDDPTAELGRRYTPPATPETRQLYDRNTDGWGDAWNLADRLIEKVEDAEFIAGMRMMKENGVESGPFTEDGAVYDYYPYWFLWVDFSLEAFLEPNPESYADLL